MKYIVKVAITYHKELSISAREEAEAREKAVDIVLEWKDVKDAEVIDITEE